MKFVLSAAALAFAAGLALTAPPPPAAAQDGTAIQKERTDLMKRMGRQTRAFRSLGDAGDAVEPAQTIIEVVALLGDKWPEGSGGGDSRAKPEIWQNMDDFKAKLNNLQQAAGTLLAAAQSGDLDTTKAAAKGVGGACGGCHRVYRVPKDD